MVALKIKCWIMSNGWLCNRTFFYCRSIMGKFISAQSKMTLKFLPKGPPSTISVGIVLNFVTWCFSLTMWRCAPRKKTIVCVTLVIEKLLNIIILFYLVLDAILLTKINTLRTLNPISSLPYPRLQSSHRKSPFLNVLRMHSWCRRQITNWKLVKELLGIPRKTRPRVARRLL